MFQPIDIAIVNVSFLHRKLFPNCVEHFGKFKLASNLIQSMMRQSSEPHLIPDSECDALGEKLLRQFPVIANFVHKDTRYHKE